jgi:hypothetical protein
VSSDVMCAHDRSRRAAVNLRLRLSGYYASKLFIYCLFHDAVSEPHSVVTFVMTFVQLLSMQKEVSTL